MNAEAIKQLVYKDWYVFRWYLVLAVLSPIVAAPVLEFFSKPNFPEQSQVIASMLVLFPHVMVAMIVQSAILLPRRDQSVVFEMSLPLSPGSYILAKHIATIAPYLLLSAVSLFISIFIFPWEKMDVVMLATLTVFAGYCVLVAGICHLKVTFFKGLMLAYLGVIIVSTGAGFLVVADKKLTGGLPLWATGCLLLLLIALIVWIVRKSILKGYALKEIRLKSEGGLFNQILVAK